MALMTSRGLMPRTTSSVPRASRALRTPGLAGSLASPYSEGSLGFQRSKVSRAPRYPRPSKTHRAHCALKTP